MERLLPLGDRAVIASAGALEAAAPDRGFADLTQKEDISDIDGLSKAAVPYFNGR